MNTTIHRFVSASLPYVNAEPHLGYAFELVLADALAREHRTRGDQVLLVTGTDDNSLKNARAALAAGIPVQLFVDEHARAFEVLAEKLDVQPDAFVRTSRDAGHRAAVSHVFERCRERGDVYKQRYRGRYCIGCEQFYAPRELEGERCPVHDQDTELVEEENYFFRLSRYEPLLLDLLRSRRLRIVPEERHAEALRFVERGLADFSVSRSAKRARGWGIPVPGDPDQVVYVWFDALIGYLSALGFPERHSRFTRHWSGAASRLHVIGKDILRFHAVYWPAILLSLGEAPPTELLVHGFVTVNGRKISKSLGNGVDPLPLIDRYGSDPLRYYLARHLHTTLDSDFSIARLHASHDGELADQLGNLVSRTLALVVRHGAGGSPDSGTPGILELELRTACLRAAEAKRRAFDELDVSGAIRAGFEPALLLNRYLDRSAPWKLARSDSAADRRRLATVLREALAAIRELGGNLAPFLPKTSLRLHETLSTEVLAASARLFPKFSACTP